MARVALSICVVSFLCGLGCADDAEPAATVDSVAADADAAADSETADSATATETTAPSDAAADTVEPDATGPADSAGDASETTDFCGPQACTEIPASVCTVDRLASQGFESRCTSGADGAECSYPAGALELCEGGPCILGACYPIPKNRCDWPKSEHVSIVTEIRFLDEPFCCADFDGDGENDNAFALMMKQAAQFIGSIDDYMALQTTSHNQNILFDVVGLEEPLGDPIDDDQVDIFGYESNFDAVEEVIDPATGMARMTLKESSFIDQVSYVPRDRAAGRVDQDHLSGWDGRFVFINFGPDDEIVELEVEDMRLAADLTIGPNGKGFVMNGDGGRGAQLWGRVKRQSVLATLDAIFHADCCTEFSEADGRVAIDPITGECHTPVSSCEETPGLCSALSDPGTCQALVALAQPDIDADGDGENESLSFGFHFRTTSVAIEWIQGCWDPNLP